VLASDPVDLEQVERGIHERLNALGPARRAELLHVLMLIAQVQIGNVGTTFWSGIVSAARVARLFSRLPWV
jgi:hypothetical protein